jgi:hypothetical protein
LTWIAARLARHSLHACQAKALHERLEPTDILDVEEDEMFMVFGRPGSMSPWISLVEKGGSSARLRAILQPPWRVDISNVHGCYVSNTINKIVMFRKGEANT